MSGGRPGWVLPTGLALLVALLAIATNLATDLKSSWIAWVVVGVLILCVVVGTALYEQRKKGAGPERSVTAKTTLGGHSSHSSGIQVRRVRTSNPDGSTTEVEEIFSEELARQSLRENTIGDDDRPLPG